MGKGLKELLVKEERVVIGTFLVSRSQAAIEVLAAAGYDFVVIDAEHFMVNPEQIEHLVTAAEAADIVPIVRVQENTDLIQRALDCGAMGVVAPMINSAEEARKVVSAAMFSPVGNRGVCNPRSVTYGARGPDHMTERYREQNEETLVIVQAETVEAMDNLEEILDVDGVDVLFIGPWDLAHSMGITGQMEEEKLKAKIQGALAKAKEKDIPAGILAWDGDDARERIKQGFKFLILAGDMLFLSNSASVELEKAKKAINKTR